VKNFRKLSNYSMAGLLAAGVILLSFFAYQQKILADTIVPGYATAHLNIQVTVPTVKAVPFKATFLPQTNSKIYYFKERIFTLSGEGLNTIEWYIRKIPEGKYTLILESNEEQLFGSPYSVELINDRVVDTTSFELNLGQSVVVNVSLPSSTPVPNPSTISSGSGDQSLLPDPNYNQDEDIISGKNSTPGGSLTPDPQAEIPSDDSPPIPGGADEYIPSF